MPSSFSNMSVADITSGIKSKKFSAREVALASINAIETLDPEIHAFLQTTPEFAMSAAEAIDAKVASGEELPLLAGVPTAFKDNMNQLGTKTTCGSKMLANYESTFTATCVNRMIEAGALPLGKLNMDEFAFGSSTETSYFGPTKNPWDLSRVPGGSSGGSAACVASGLATITLGSDTGGSIRQPASFCGVIGMKPTYGVVSRFGVVAFGSSLDQVGPFARSISDIAYALNALKGRDPLDCTSQDTSVDFLANLDQGVDGMSIGIVREFMEAEGLTSEVSLAMKDVIDALEEMGANIVEVELPNAYAAMSAYYVIGPCEAFSNLSRFDSVRYGNKVSGAELGEQYELSRADGFGLEAKRRIMLGSYLLSSGVYNKYYYPAQQVRTLITEDYSKAYEKVSAIILPSSPRSAFKFGEVSDPVSMYLSDMFTISLNIAGNGGLSLPVAFGKDTSLPIGAQIIGPQFKDENILRVASALEKHFNIAKLAPIASEIKGDVTKSASTSDATSDACETGGSIAKPHANASETEGEAK